MGQKFEVSIVASDGTTVIQTKTTVVPANGFFINFPQILVSGTNYYVDYYADENSNAVCNAPPTDHVWRSHNYIDFTHGTITLITAAGVAGDVVWATVHDDPFLTNPTGMNTCAQLP